MRPVTAQDVVEPSVEHVSPDPSLTVYPVMSEPSLEGAVHETSAWPFPAVAVTPVGASGTVDTDTVVAPSELA